VMTLPPSGTAHPAPMWFGFPPTQHVIEPGAYREHDAGTDQPNRRIHAGQSGERVRDNGVKF
jgi:hypothetical protein